MSIQFILNRRSVRKYSGEPVNEKDLTLLLEAGMAAPSAKNRQPWHFVVVRDGKTLEKLSEAHPYGKMLAGAATENILIAVTALELGAVWLGCHPRPERVSAIRRVLGIPEHIGVLSLISIGHPAEEKEPRTQYDEAKVHKEKW